MKKILTSGALILFVAFVAGCGDTLPKSPFRSALFHFRPSNPVEPPTVILIFHGVRNLSGASMSVRAPNVRIEVDESLHATEAVVSGIADPRPVGWKWHSWRNYVVHVLRATVSVASIEEKKKWEKVISDAEMESAEPMGPKKPINVRPPE